MILKLKNLFLAWVRLCFSLLLAHCCASDITAQTWERIGPNGGNVISLAASSDGPLYLGTSDGHVFASSDAAARWELRGRAGGRLDGVVQQLLVDSRASQRVFAALWFQDPSAGGGIFFSDDGARTWRLAGLQGEAVRTIEQSRSQPDVFVAGTHTGVFRSNDSGSHWERISPRGDEELKNIDSLTIDPGDARVIYAGTYHLPWKTTDGGKTWAAIAAGMIDDSDVMTIRIDAANPARVFASACSGIYRSENGGLAWTKLQGIPYASRRTQAIVQDPTDPRIIYAGTTEGLWLSRDSGETWARATSREWVINVISLKADAAGGSKIILGTEEQGILVSQDSAATFSPSNAGFSHRVVAALLDDPRNPQHMLARVSGLSHPFIESRDAGLSWQPLPGDQTLPSIEKLFATESGWWASLVGGGAARYDDANSQWLRLRFPQLLPVRSRQRVVPRSSKRSPSALKPEPQVFDIQSSKSGVYFATADGLWSGEVSTSILRQVAPATRAGIAHSLDVLPDDAELWTLTSEKLLHSLDAGKTWTDATPASLQASLLWVRVIPSATGPTLFLGTHRGVFKRSLDASDDWQLLQSGLPAAATNPPWFSTRQIVIPSKNGGLYLSRDNGNFWQRLDGSSETGIFTGIFNDSKGGLIVGSRNEGILHWTSASPTP
jgi:photosystem II stability/assembly factor-like uncharacterized protein